MADELIVNGESVSEKTEKIPELDRVDHMPCQFGDLLLLLTTDDTTTSFLVSRLSLRMAAVVWNKALDPETPFSKLHENIRFQNRTIPVFKLYDDHCDSLLWILCIAHLKHEFLPSKVTMSDLRHFTITCRKYDCAETITAVARPWVFSWEKEALTDGNEDWLLIGPFFGQHSKIGDLKEKLTRNISVRLLSGCREVFIGERWLDIKFIPDSVIDEILDRRLQFIRRIAFALYIAERILCRAAPVTPGKPDTYPKPYQGLDESSATSKLQGMINQEVTCSEDCLSMAYGSLLRSIERFKLDKYVWNIATETFNHWDGSIQEIIKMLDQSVVRIQPSSQHTGLRPHRVSCGLAQLERDIKTAMDVNNLSNDMKPAAWERIWSDSMARGLLKERTDRPRDAEYAGNSIENATNNRSIEDSSGDDFLSSFSLFD